MRESVRALGEPWTFGATPEDIAARGRAHRLTVQRDLGADEYRRAYREAWEQAQRAGGVRGYAFYRVAILTRD